MAVFSDYGGEHEGSSFYTYSFLVTGLDLAIHFQNEMTSIRTRYGLGQTEIAFKKFQNGRIRAALPDYLTALNNLLPGLLFTLVVDKQISGLFGVDPKKDRSAILKQWKDTGFHARKPKVIEKLVHVVHVAAFLAGLLGHDRQKIFWMTDNDAISQNRQMARETLKIFAHVLETYTRRGVSFELVGGCTTFDERNIETLDLLSAADIASGALADYLTNSQVNENEGIMVKRGCDSVLQWMPLDGVGLSKLAMVIRPDQGGVQLGCLQLRSDVQQDIIDVPIFC